jgi:acetoin utilization protein AcuB
MKQARVRHLPVVDENNAIVGILSDRDLLRASKSESLTLGACASFLGEDLDPEATVSDYMSAPVESVYSDDALKEVVNRMIQERISALMVKDVETQRYVGIITTEDLLRVLLHYLKKDSGEDALFLKLSHVTSRPEFSYFATELSTSGI